MEQSSYKDLTQQIFREVLMEDEFRDWSDCGIVIQAYLQDSEADLLKFREWVDERETPISIRLVKGRTGTTRRFKRGIMAGKPQCTPRSGRPMPITKS